MISEKTSEIVKIISIAVSAIYGYIINYICLLGGKEGKMISSLMGLLIITAIYIIIKVNPPKSEFFKVRSK